MSKYCRYKDDYCEPELILYAGSCTHSLHLLFNDLLSHFVISGYYTIISNYYKVRLDALKGNSVTVDGYYATILSGRVKRRP